MSGPTTNTPLIRRPLPEGTSPSLPGSPSMRGGRGRGRGLPPTTPLPARGKKRGGLATSTTPYSRPASETLTATPSAILPTIPTTPVAPATPAQQHHVSFSLPVAGMPSGYALPMMASPSNIPSPATIPGPGPSTLHNMAGSFGMQTVRPLTIGTVGAGAVDMDDDMDEDDIGEDEFTEHDEKMNLEQKADLSLLMQNFGSDHMERLTRYRNVTISKQATRKLVTQSINQSVSLHVAQIIGGFAKTFVSEVIAKARQAQEARGEHGLLAPDDVREAYRMYAEEAGRVGAAKPIRGKRLFVR